MNSLKNRILEGLSTDERAELESAVYALGVVDREDHGPGDQIMNPNGLSAMMNKLSPNVRQTLLNVYHLTNEERGKPFDPKMTGDNYAELLDLDPQALQRVRNTLASAEVAAGLGRRMGMDSDNPDTSPPTMREQLAAAIDQDRPMAARRQFVEQALSNASEGLSRRQAIATIMDTKENDK